MSSLPRRNLSGASRGHSGRRGRTLPTAVLVTVLILGAGTSAAADAPTGHWVWPVENPREVAEPYRAPSTRYGAGHRGIDIAATGLVRAPADGVVAFSGTVVDRPLLTIAHADGLVTTLEPVNALVPAGTAVTAGQPVGTVATGGHVAEGRLHVGVRWNGEYINPLGLFGGARRAVLLPCCE
ncbi:murein hydrolase activator EnvC family protein [Microbacterium gorillae]|uniref:murein hydrolase activator EnvC family protein n=1 Tax=Microbacterium gorillae TaxID=1231063 RepID=UPI000B9BBD4C|nr:M23 family metallopeptidase [Microbacterium gorillae]